MKNNYEIPEQCLCSICNTLKDSNEFSKSHFLVWNKEPPICRNCSVKDSKLWAKKALETKVVNEDLMIDHIFTKLGYDINRDIHEQFLERHPELQNK
jgi:hypothetical protein